MCDLDMTYKSDEVKAAISDTEWQAFRVSLKGKNTVLKLARLDYWLDAHVDPRTGLPPRRYRVQVMNYINALKRGGQLDREGNIVR